MDTRMTNHNHREHVEWCYRCDLAAAELPSLPTLIRAMERLTNLQTTEAPDTQEPTQ